jgi:imidazolonepropionase-like amidohydrolase
LKILKEELFSAENLTKINPGSGKATHEKPQTLMISGGIIRPMISGSTDKVDAIGIADGKVVVTGTESDVTDYMTANHKGFQNKILTATQTLLPGLIEPHVHMIPTA